MIAERHSNGAGRAMCAVLCSWLLLPSHFAACAPLPSTVGTGHTWDPEVLSEYWKAEANVATKRQEAEQAAEILDSVSAASRAAQQLLDRTQNVSLQVDRWAASAHAYPKLLAACSGSIDRFVLVRGELAGSAAELRSVSSRFNAAELHDTLTAKKVDDTLKSFYGLTQSSKDILESALADGDQCAHTTNEQSNHAARLRDPAGNTRALARFGYDVADDFSALSTEALVFRGGSDLPADIIETLAATRQVHDAITSRLIVFSSAREIPVGSTFLYKTIENLFVSLKSDLGSYQKAATELIAENAASDYWQAGVKVKASACNKDPDCMAAVEAQAANSQERVADAQWNCVIAQSRVEIDASELNYEILQSKRLSERVNEASRAMHSETIIGADELQTLATAVRQLTQWRDEANERLRLARFAADRAYEKAFGAPRLEAPIAILPIVPESGVSQLASGGYGQQAVAIDIRDHGYELVTQFGDESKGYGAYTYVLFPRRVNDSKVPIAPTVVQRYNALLDAIYASTLERSKFPADRTHRNLIDLFCIPSLGKSGTASTMDDYSTTIALQYLSVAKGGVIRRTSIMEKLVASEGPFLLTTFVPMNKTLSNSPLLLADLSGIPNDTYSSVLADYKLHLTQLRAVSDQQTWEPAIGQRAALLFVHVAPDFMESMKWVKKFVGVSGKEAGAAALN
jgi:hypothetical protein